MLEVPFPFLSFFILDFKYKSMWLVNAYLGCEIIATLGVEYNERLLLLLPLDVHKLLMFNGVQNIVKESLDHSIIIILIWKFAIVLRHGGGQMEHKLPIVTILTQINLGITTSQIEI